MSAILSADDLNDFISPGVACIKPVETLPKEDDANPYEVTTEDKVQVQNPAPASISLTDCLACSGCVTSAEAVLVSLQSHSEVLNTLDSYPSLNLSQIQDLGNGTRTSDIPANAKLFVASVSPQVRASLAATFGITESQAGHMVQQFLSGPQGLRTGGEYNSDFAYVVDTNCMRDVCLVLSADEVEASLSDRTKPRPVLTSACPGWVCYAEKTHPHVLPHLSALKSPQALTGTLLKSVLSKKLGISPSQIWHLAIMPCFDKKLEASREELTDKWWSEEAGSSLVRDVDCVITSRELLTLAEGRDVQLDALPLIPIPDSQRIAFPDLRISSFLFPPISSARSAQSVESGTSGGYLSHILQTYQSQHPGSIITTQKGRNSDVVEYTLQSSANQSILKCARYYGFRNIQNLVRKLKPARQSKLPGAAARRTAASGGNEYAYVEVMACPGGCTNGGGQIKLEDVASIIPQTRGEEINLSQINTSLGQKEWLARVDEAYFSASSDSDSETNEPLHDTARTPPPASSLHLNGTNGIQKDTEAAQVPANDAMEVDDPLEVDHEIQINNISPAKIHQFLEYWSASTGVELDKLAYTTFRKVESDVGKKSTAKKMGDSERIAAIAGLQGGGW